MSITVLVTCLALAIVWATLPRHYPSGESTTETAGSHPNFIIGPTVDHSSGTPTDKSADQIAAERVEMPVKMTAEPIASNSSVVRLEGPGESGSSTLSNGQDPSFASPVSGTILGGGAYGPAELQLRIDNGTDSDAVVTLTKVAKRDEVVSFYVRKRDAYTLPGVEPGSYDVWVRKGLSWNEAAEDFNLPESYSMFERPVEFTQSQTQDGTIHFGGKSLTLHTVRSGNIGLFDLAKKSMPLIRGRHS